MGFSIKIVLDREIGSVMDILASKGNERLGAENTVHFCTELLQYRTEVLVNGTAARGYTLSIDKGGKIGRAHV